MTFIPSSNSFLRITSVDVTVFRPPYVRGLFSDDKREHKFFEIEKLSTPEVTFTPLVLELPIALPLHVVFHAQVALKERRFDIHAVDYHPAQESSVSRYVVACAPTAEQRRLDALADAAKAAAAEAPVEQRRWVESLLVRFGKHILTTLTNVPLYPRANGAPPPSFADLSARSVSIASTALPLL